MLGIKAGIDQSKNKLDIGELNCSMENIIETFLRYTPTENFCHNKLFFTFSYN
jgi:hypothetical protein